MTSPPALSKQSPKPARPHLGAQPGAVPSGARWLLLIHQIPPKPDYLRVKIGRRLQRVGAVAIKNSVYVLPAQPESYEDFQWIVREIEEGGGDAFVSEASLVGEGLTNDAVRARFDAARNEEYRDILRDAKAAPKTEHELAKLRRRFEAASAIDFFGASEGNAVRAMLNRIEQVVRQRATRASKRQSSARPDSATWVTRRDVHVDRIASAWLIRRFIDRQARFRFVQPDRYVQRTGELRFDMFEAEYTHVGDACTFETLLTEFVADDAALRQIAEIVHDVDCKDGKFRREEAPGFARMIAGIVALCPRDEDRLERGVPLMDELYAAFGGGRLT